ncbi:MAG: hypothetical protein ACYC3G_02600 [Minisyncoccota bacterium]
MAKKEKRYKLLFVYAFYKNEGSDGVHEDVLDNATRAEGIEHAKKLWPGIDECRVSDTQLSYPYGYLFEKDRSPKKIKAALVGDVPSLKEIEKEIKRLEDFNK